MSQYGAPNLQNRPPPTISPQGFQTVPLGIPKPIPQPNNAIIPDSFAPPPGINHSSTPTTNQYGPTHTLTTTNILPQSGPAVSSPNLQNSGVPPNTNQNYTPLEQRQPPTNQFPPNVNQPPLKANQPPLNMYGGPNMPGQGFNQIHSPPQNLNNDHSNTRPSNMYNPMQNLNNDVNAAHFPPPSMLRPPVGQPPFQQPPTNIPVAANTFNSPQQSRPPLIGQPPLPVQPPMVGHVSGPGEIQLQDGSVRPPLLPATSINQFGQPQPAPPKGQFPPSNQFNNLPNQVHNMNISGPRPYVNDNEMHGPPPMGAKQGFPPRPGQVPGFSAIPGQVPISGHTDMSRMAGSGIPPLPGQPPMSGPMPPVSGPYPQHYQQPQPKRLDPDQMPSPVSDFFLF